MRTVLESKGYVVTTIAASGAKALESIRSNVPDLVIMDIHLEGPIDGITTAKAINAECYIPIIYVTQFGNDDIFRVAKETNPMNFITKPFTDNALIQAVEIAFQHRYSKTIGVKDDAKSVLVDDAFFVLTKNGRHRKILLNDVMYIESSGAYTKLYILEQDALEPECISVTGSSNNVVTQLNFEYIVQVHRSYYVNAQKVDDIYGDVLTVRAKEIPIGSTFRKAFYSSFKFIHQHAKQT